LKQRKSIGLDQDLIKDQESIEAREAAQNLGVKNTVMDIESIEDITVIGQEADMTEEESHQEIVRSILGLRL